jgi:hypothetical protein
VNKTILGVMAVHPDPGLDKGMFIQLTVQVSSSRPLRQARKFLCKLRPALPGVQVPDGWIVRW